MYWVFLDISIASVGNSGDGGVGALREDNGPAPLAVLLGEVDNRLGDFLDILGGDVV